MTDPSRRLSLPLIVALATAALATCGSGLAQVADLNLTKVDSPDPVTAGSNLTYTITVSNEGPDDATTVALSDPLPTGTTFQSLASPGGWFCSTPAVGALGTVSCSIATFPVGSELFTLVVGVDAGVANGTVLGNTATVSTATTDPSPTDQSASTDTTVAAPTTAFGLTKTDAPDPVVRGTNLTYTLTASNNGVVPIDEATLSDTLPAGTTFVSLLAPGGWTCSTPAVGGTGALSCSIVAMPIGAATFTLVVDTDSSLTPGTALDNQAQLAVIDQGRPDSATAAATTQVDSGAALAASKTVASQRLPGSPVTYTLVLTNSGSHTQADNPGPELTDVLPPELVLVSATATAGTAVATLATNTVTWDGSIPGGGSVTITIQAIVDPSVALGTQVTNQATLAWDADGDGNNEAAGVSDDPALGGASDPTRFALLALIDVPTVDGFGLVLLALLLVTAAAIALRRRSRAA